MDDEGKKQTRHSKNSCPYESSRQKNKLKEKEEKKKYSLCRTGKGKWKLGVYWLSVKKKR